MEYRFTPGDDNFRRELRQFIEDELPPGWEGGGRWPEEYDWDFTMQMRGRLADRGWLTMHWPEEYGGQDASPVRRRSTTKNWPTCERRGGIFSVCGCLARR